MTMSSEPNRSIPISKRGLRKAILAEIEALDRESRSREESELALRFPRLPGWAGAQTVMLYVSAFPEELKTDAFWARALEAGKRVICPRVDREARRLRLHWVQDPRNELSPGVLGIPEPRAELPEIAPESIDWVLVPGLAFDERGYRLGRGAGHYDRLLPRLRPDAACWALCLSCQLIPSLPIEPHDMPLDGVCTPDRMILGVRASDKDLGFTPTARADLAALDRDQSMRTSTAGGFA